MANLDQPTGFRPAGEVKQAAPFECGSAVYPGDMVCIASDGQIDAVAAGGAILGCALQYGASGDKILVSIDGSQLYVVNASATELDAQTDIGNVADIVVGTASTLYRISRQELDTTTLSTTSGQLAILGIEPRPDNALGANVDVIVKINENQLKEAFAGI